MKAKKPVLHECRASSCSYNNRSKVSSTYLVRDSPWRFLKSLLRHSVEFTDRVQISFKAEIKYLNKIKEVGEQ